LLAAVVQAVTVAVVAVAVALELQAGLAFLFPPM
jgi:hypothetical protein